MASSAKRTRPKRIRHRIETDCETEAEKEALAIRLDRVRRLLTPPGRRLLDNEALLNSMFDVVERHVNAPSGSPTPTALAEEPITKSLMRNSGKILML